MMLIFQGRNRITQRYKPGVHNGLDIVGDDSHDVLCPVSGVVRSSAMITDRSDPTWEWGNYVRVDDKDGNRLFFCHLESRAVKAGQKVDPGDRLGVMGNTGYSFGAHTHFEVRKSDGRTSLDPAAYLGVPNTEGSYTAGKTGWVQASAGWYWYEDGAPVRSCWVKDGGWWYYLGEDGKMLTGLIEVDGKGYYLNQERKTVGGVYLPVGACIVTDGSGAVLFE